MVTSQFQHEKMHHGKMHEWAVMIVSITSWMMLLMIVAAWCFLSVVLIPFFPVACFLSIVIILLTLMVPLEMECPNWVAKALDFSVQSFAEYLELELEYQDLGSLEGFIGSAKPCIVAYEPHGVLPQGICAFCHLPPEPLPSRLRQTYILVSSACFQVPILRNLWWWLGCRSVSRGSMQNILNSGRSVAICPGGVQECLYMEKGIEAVYLRKRLGFVRMACQTGASIVPVYGIGQSDLYRYWRPFFDSPKGWISKKFWARFARKIGFVPMLVAGVYGSPIPGKTKLTIRIGKPIEVPHIENPDDDVVQEWLDVYIDALKELYNTHDFSKDGQNQKRPLVIH